MYTLWFSYQLLLLSPVKHFKNAHFEKCVIVYYKTTQKNEI